jgi:methionine biosynthesis protein MetW
MIDRRVTAAGNIATERLDLKLIAEMVPLGSRVLDIGCGQGDLLDILARDRNVSGHGLELSQTGVNTCVARGLSVVQGDADRDLSYYPDDGFDVVILSQTLQATQRPKDVLQEMARVGKQLIVSIPNFGHWAVRFDLLRRGRMPETGLLSAPWYETANIHLCTLFDFVDLSHEVGLHIDRHLLFVGDRVREGHAPISWLDNWRATLAIFTLQRD